MNEGPLRLLLVTLAAMASPWLVACGDDATEDADEARPGHIVDRPDAQTHVSPPVLDSGLVYTFPCVGERSDPTYEATFTSVYLDIFCDAGCTNPYCHGSRGSWGDMDLASSIEVAYSNLVSHHTGTKVPADGRDTCRESALLRVAPGSPEQSLLYLKITDAAPCGTHMPPASSGLPMLGPEQIDHVRRWIEAGAPLNRPAEDAGADASHMSATASL